MSTIIHLIQCNEVDINHNNIPMFKTSTSQYNWFMSRTVVKSFNDSQFVRDNQMVKIKANIDDIRICNYAIIFNGKKYQYYFVINHKYINNTVTSLELKLDVMQTYQFDFTFRETLVERMHYDRWNNDGTVNTTYFHNQDDLPTGEIVQKNNSTLYSYIDNGCYIVTSSSMLGYSSQGPKVEDGETSDEMTLRKNIVTSARKLIGKPYVWGGNYPPLGSSSGTDCSGLCQWAYNDNGYGSLCGSRWTTDTIYSYGLSNNSFVDVEHAQIGDLVLNPSGHVYLISNITSGGQFSCVEAQQEGVPILERTFNPYSDMTQMYYVNLVKDII